MLPFVRSPLDCGRLAFVLCAPNPLLTRRPQLLIGYLATHCGCSIGSEILFLTEHEAAVQVLNRFLVAAFRAPVFSFGKLEFLRKPTFGAESTSFPLELGATGRCLLSLAVLVTSPPPVKCLREVSGRAPASCLTPLPFKLTWLPLSTTSHQHRHEGCLNSGNPALGAI